MRHNYKSARLGRIAAGNSARKDAASQQQKSGIRTRYPNCWRSIPIQHWKRPHANENCDVDCKWRCEQRRRNYWHDEGYECKLREHCGIITETIKDRIVKSIGKSIKDFERIAVCKNAVSLFTLSSLFLFPRTSGFTTQSKM